MKTILIITLEIYILLTSLVIHFLASYGLPWLLNEAKALTKQWVMYYNTVRPHSSLNYQPPAPLSVQELRS